MAHRLPAAALVLYALLTPTALAADDDWPMFRGDAARTGAPFDQASGGTGVVKWKSALVNESESSPAVARGKVFVGSDDGNLTAVFVKNGTRNWTYDMKVRVTSSPVVVETPIPAELRDGFRWMREGRGDLVIIGDWSGRIHALKAHDGKVWWTQAAAGSVIGAPAVEGNRVIVASSDGVVRAISLDRGDALWSRTTGSEIRGSPLAVNGRVYVGTVEGALHALDSGTGTVDWTFDAGARLGSPAYARGLLVVGSQAGRVHALAAIDGGERWTYQAGGAVFGSPAVRDGLVFVPSLDEHLYALGLDDGDLRWKARVKPTSSPAAAGGAVFVGAVGAVVALDPSDGSKMWRTAANARFDSSPAVVNGTLYLASSRIGLKQGAEDHHLYALNAGDATPLSVGDGVPPPEEPYEPPTGPDEGSPPVGEDGGEEKDSEEGGLPLPGVVALAALGLAALLRPRRRED